MLDESTSHYREIIDEAARLMSIYFQQAIHFSKVVQLSEPDRRNIILRLLIDNPTTHMPQSLILKKTSIDKRSFDVAANDETEIEQLSRFAHDWAGLEFLTSIKSTHGPHFYVGSLAHKFILIEDLGLDHPSLVGPLTRPSSVENIQKAEMALIAYVRRVGKMHADTLGKANQFTSILNKIYPRALRYNFISETNGLEVLSQLRLLTGDNSHELGNEIKDVLEFSKTPGDFNVYLHGDICPDNVYFQGNEIRLIDFEFGDYGHALIDGVYLRMSMPSCWCSKAVPDNVLQRMEAIYRDELKQRLDLAADDSFYNKQLVYACAYWIIRALQSLHKINLIDNEWICPSGPVDPDSTWVPKENAFRPRILSRLATFIACAKSTGHLPQLCKASTQLLSHLKKIWPEAQNIDVFPVFSKENVNE
ncbi:MAG: phosphotransferase [Gammaproteobacteria bacterium]|nr:phosphotransferase [Gammaproteobacteria bacterium]